MIALAAIPLGVAASYLFDEVTLLGALYVAVATAFVSSLLALATARRARYRLARSVRRSGERLVRAGWVMAWAGLYVAITGGLALAFYAYLSS